MLYQIGILDDPWLANHSRVVVNAHRHNSSVTVPPGVYQLLRADLSLYMHVREQILEANGSPARDRNRCFPALSVRAGQRRRGIRGGL